MAKSENLSITLPAEIAAMIRKDAEENFRSVSAEIAFICSQYFKNKTDQSSQSQ